MFRNYLIIAWRSLLKNKTATLINIFGLATGIAFLLVTGAYVWSEWQVNATLKDSENTYLVQSRWRDPNVGYDFTTLGPLAKALGESYPSLVKSYYHFDGVNSIVSHGTKQFNERLQVGDSTFLTMFSFPLLHGDAATAFQNPASVAITAAKARQYFGRTDVVGQTLTIQSFSGGRQDFAITAVLRDPPYNTVMGYAEGTDQVFLPAANLRFFGRESGFLNWNNPYIISYVRLQPGVKPADLQKPVEQLLKLNTTADIQKDLHIFFTPVRDYYLQSDNGLPRRMMSSLSFVALFILLMAVINFINISIGNAASRLREIGVRKVMGSSKRQLILQFLTESILLAAFSTLCGILLYLLTRPTFGSILGKELPSLTSMPLPYLGIPVMLTLLIGVLAGIYPALVLSRQKSVESLKGRLETVREKVSFRYALIALQFITAITVFVAAVVINKQVSFFFQADLGYDRNAVITARVPRDWTPKGVQHLTDLRNQFAAMPDIAAATFSFEIPDGGSSGNANTLYKQGHEPSEGINAESLTTDEHYLDTYKIPLVAGAFFNAGTPAPPGNAETPGSAGNTGIPGGNGNTATPGSAGNIEGAGNTGNPGGGRPDSTGMVLNEAAAKSLGWTPQQALGQKVRLKDYPAAFTIGGVVKDFHFGPFRESIRPLFFLHVQNSMIFRFLSFKLRPGNLPARLAAVQKKWSELLPDAPFEYTFMDDTLAHLYEREIQMKKASGAATAIALVIVLLGVFSIVTQSINRRTKEVGIRKVLGASVTQVIVLFAKEFSRSILIANLVAWPLAWLVLDKWLKNYAYRISLNATPFLFVSLILAATVALLITLKTLRTALANPTKNLRTE